MSARTSRAFRAAGIDTEPTDLSTVWNPWEASPPAVWPNAILSRETEQTLALVSLRDGIDLGVISMAIISAVSAAAPKDARFYPYRRDGWAVPPILWVSLVGESGTRKTLLETIALSAVREAHADLWLPYQAELRHWNSLPAKQRGPKPTEPRSYIIADPTPEALQRALSITSHGSAIVKDELVSLLEFTRYRDGGNGAAARAFYLSAYEDQPCAVLRVTRDGVYVQHTGLSMFGGIQPSRLSGFRKDMETDGLLQRFIVVIVRPAIQGNPQIDAGTGLIAIHKTIKRLCHFDACSYSTTPEGGELIRQTELLGRDYAIITDYGEGWPGFCYKLHGTHARLALVIHLLEDPENGVIPTDTVARASRLVHGFIIQHASDFYGSLTHGGRNITQDIAGWLLTRGPVEATERERITASDLTNAVRSCRPLGSKGIADALDPLVTGGWLTPEHDYPNNRAWFFNPAIRSLFAERTVAERERRAAVREQIAQIAARRRQGLP
jgi:hypothetical protein